MNRPHVAMLQMIDMKPWGKGQRIRRTTMPTKAWKGRKYWFEGKDIHHKRSWKDNNPKITKSLYLQLEG